jgi:hypothetical protein
MTQTADATDGAGRAQSYAPMMFGLTVFASAALIFLVEPMIARLVLPTLGGSPMVWNTCMAFFQAALLIGYAYAHALQRVKSLKTQVIIHAVVLIAAALVLPLEVSKVLGQPGQIAPGLWLLGVLTLTIGAPFAALSATAPLAQAWYARVRAGHGDANNPYVLYAASNLGSLIALLAYPIAVEPAFSLNLQTLGWSVGYVAFVFLMLLTAYFASRASGAAPPLVAAEGGEKAVIRWKDRLIWIGLAAAPSSLMLGVTTYLTTDIASTPFLWVLPLSLYLLTFIFAFSAKPPLDKFYILVLQAALAIATAYGFGRSFPILLQLLIPLLSFFFTAYMCHTALAERRPHPSRLTEFYLLVSVGGVVGGGFNAFLAPAIFNTIAEYPLVLVLACLARPWNWGRLNRTEWLLLIAAVAPAAFVVALTQLFSLLPAGLQGIAFAPWLKYLLIVPVVFTFLLRGRGLIFTGLVALILITSLLMGGRPMVIAQDRSFFGVLRLSHTPIPGFSQEARVLAHGTTLHGVQFTEPELACTPRVYYGPNTAIGQVFAKSRLTHPNLTVGAVGMGVGSVAGFNQAGDVTRFFEIDQHVVDMATDPKNLSYINGCAKGKVDWVVGDARLKMVDEPKDKYDILLVDAFSSDAVPAHLLTRQALELYLSKVKPDGVVIMHLSNRHLDLMAPVAATAMAAGGFPLAQHYEADPLENARYVESSQDVIIIGRDRAALAPYEADKRWGAAESHGVRVWTDDYTNIFGAMVRAFKRP